MEPDYDAAPKSMPEVTRMIGGVELFAWQVTRFGSQQSERIAQAKAAAMEMLAATTEGTGPH